MADIRPFAAIRPAKEKAAHIAALPYDVYNTQEAREEIEREPESFLRIDRAETQFDTTIYAYDLRVYEKAHDILWGMVESGDFIRDDAPYYYIYELTMDGRVQTGIMACASIDDYQNNVIRKHEKTRTEKEQDRVCHVDICNAQTGPIFLAYRGRKVLRRIVEKNKEKPAVNDFTSPDGVRHRVWIIDDAQDIETITSEFSEVHEIYIADGHHRTASAVRVGMKRRSEHPDYDGTEEFNYFMALLFPDAELKILDYNRVVKDLNGMSNEEFLAKVRETFAILPVERGRRKPHCAGEFSMYLDGQWYLCGIPKDKIPADDPVGSLDVSLLQNLLLHPILGIGDPKTDPRIGFVGGIRGLDELERRCRLDAKVAFAMYPTSIDQLFAVADAGLLMPPKSTWFEPKPRSGLFIHEI